ncbi:MAG TPA: FtsQ-type POTRA domain-containing protein [Pseudoclavibacter sp.]|nr:FtsQ-type POTRA domain-containing protein [Pseudoclavibacter sp.]
MKRPEELHTTRSPSGGGSSWWPPRWLAGGRSSRQRDAGLHVVPDGTQTEARTERPGEADASGRQPDRADSAASSPASAVGGQDAPTQHLQEEAVPEVREARRRVRALTRARRRFERRERRQYTERARRAMRKAALVGGTILAIVGVVAAIVTSPVLRVRDIVITGTSRVDAAAVEQALSPEIGALIAFVDHDDIAQRLSEFSLIESISVQSQLPSTLLITITERTPIGIVSADGGYTVFDAAGVTIETVTEKPADLPVFSVNAVSSQDIGFRSAVEVLSSLPDSIRDSVTAISGTTRDDITVTLSSGLVIVWGDASQTDYKVQVLSAVLTAAPDATKVDLSAPDVPVVE